MIPLLPIAGHTPVHAHTLGLKPNRRAAILILPHRADPDLQAGDVAPGTDAGATGAAKQDADTGAEAEDAGEPRASAEEEASAIDVPVAPARPTSVDP